MNPADMHATFEPPKGHGRMLTFSGGGWVILLAIVVSLVLTLWGVAPVMMRSVDRPPGDGQDIDNYGFDLANLTVPRRLVAPVMLHRDIAPAMINPSTVIGTGISELNRTMRGKFLVPGDRVIGVSINNESRAYPIRLLNVHEIVNDTLGGVPIAVTYHWPCDSVVVFDRRNDGTTLEFGVSGLVYNSNLLLYDRSNDSGTASTDASYSSSLWSQLLGRAVSGPMAGTQLTHVPATLSRWDDWLASHDDTTVIASDPSYFKRYGKSTPHEYFYSDHLLPGVTVEPMPVNSEWPLKSRVVAVSVNGQRRVYPVQEIARRIKASETPGRWNDTLGGVTLWFECDEIAQTVIVTSDSPDAKIHVVPAFWFAWHAMYPDDDVLN